jgi:protein-tyrosine phosphatase
MMNQKRKILFICTGNIIRSPLAEHLFAHLAAKKGLGGRYAVASAGTISYHIGESPDSRMRRVAAKHGLEYDGKSRQFVPQDYVNFDLLIVMDNSHLSAVLAQAQRPEQEDRVHLLREFDPQTQGAPGVPDPYYGGAKGFENTYRIVERSVQGLLEALEQSQL